MGKRKIYPIGDSKEGRGVGGNSRRKSAKQDLDDTKKEIIDFKRDKRGIKDSTQRPKWWTEATGGGACGTLWQWVDRHRTTWSMDAIADLIAEAIYSDTPVAAGGHLGPGGRYLGMHGGMNPVNAIKNLVDTGTARLTKVRSMPVISADDADYDEKRFATEQSRVLRRKMGNGDMESAAPDIVKSFIIRGTTWGKIERCDGDTEFCHVPAYEVVYDRREALYAKRVDHLATIAHVRPVNRDALCAKFPWAEAKILGAPAFSRVDPWMSYTYVGPNTADMIEIAEAWHPASSYDADDGQWVLCVRGTCIARAPWKCTRYPLDPVYWTRPTRGVGRGTGLVYEQAAAQAMVNDILQDAREALRHGSQLKVFVPRGTVNKHHLKARHPAVIEHDGVAPTYIAPAPVSQQAWGIAFQIIEEMHNSSGISMWAAQGKASLPGTPSGKALDTMDDQQSDRFAHVESGYQQWRVGMGLRHVDVARMMHDEANGKAGDKKFDEQPPPIDEDDLAAWIRDNKWPDVDIDGGDYHLTLEPENFITGTRGGKLNEINEAAKAGLIPDPSLTAMMFDEPDIARANRGILGPARRIEDCLSGLADLKVPYIDVAPDPEMNRPLAKLLAMGELEDAKANRAKPEIVQRFRDFIADLKRLDDQEKGAPSLAGAQANNIVAQQNAGDLMGAGGPPPMAPGAGPGGPPPNGAGSPLPMPPPGGMPS